RFTWTCGRGRVRRPVQGTAVALSNVAQTLNPHPRRTRRGAAGPLARPERWRCVRDARTAQMSKVPSSVVSLIAILGALIAEPSSGTRASAAGHENVPPVLVNPGDQVTPDNAMYQDGVLANRPAAYWRLGDS